MGKQEQGNFVSPSQSSFHSNFRGNPALLIMLQPLSSLALRRTLPSAPRTWSPISSIQWVSIDSNHVLGTMHSMVEESRGGHTQVYDLSELVCLILGICVLYCMN